MRGVFVGFLLISVQLMSQTSMEDGFKYLDAQQFAKAEQFFTKILLDYPDNKTANICLARAKGLGGDANSALQILNKLNRSYPDDKETLLNLAEAYLWDKDPKLAIKNYQIILKEDPENFTANFGTANSLSSMFRYDEALAYIDKALNIDPNNEGAKTSRRFVLYGVADNQRKNTNYREAINTLDIVLEEYRNDEQALINKGICYLSMKDVKTAEWIFDFMYERDINKFEAALLLSHINLIKHKNNQALSFAEKAIDLADVTDETKYTRASIQKVNVLGASKKFIEAHEIINTLHDQYGDSNDLTLARGRMNVWDQEFSKGLKTYSTIKDTNYVLRMGLAEAYRAKKQNLKAKKEIEEALVLIPNQPDATGLLREIELEQSPKLEIETFTSSDIGNNNAKNLFAELTVPIKEKHRIMLMGGIRQTEQNKIEEARQRSFMIGDHFQINHKFALKFSGGIINYSTETGANKNASILNSSINYQFTKNHGLGLTYSKDALKYSTDLIRSGILKHSIVGTYLFSKHNWPSLYLQYDLTNQTDDNQRSIFFGSLFYQFKTFPLVKLGFNYTNMSYEFSRPLLYFSPNQYEVVEAFIHFGNDFDKKAKLIYHFEFTFGKQRIETDPRINTSRISLDLGYRISDRYKLFGQYFYSTAANSTNKGFSFTQYKLKLTTIL